MGRPVCGADPRTARSAVNFEPTPIAGAIIVKTELVEDERGGFGRSFCQDEFRAQGLTPPVAQSSVSWNRRRGTLRGMHYQAKPHEEVKLVRCTRGAVWDVIVDLRGNSPTRLHWHGLELNSENRLALYIPEGVAHGFQTLCDDSEVLYQMSVPYFAGLARGVLWNDPAVGVDWPIANPILSERDRSHPPLP